MSRTANRGGARVGSGPLILGVSGGTAPTRAPLDPTDEHRMIVDYDTTHDSAAVLVRDGVVLAAVEEERLNRLKHTNKIAVGAIRACLDEAGLAIDDIDRIAYYTREDIYDHTVIRHLLKYPSVRMPWSGRAYLAEVLSEDLGQPIDPARLVFVEHHHAHASSAYVVGPFADALVVTLDGKGDGLSGTVWAGRGGELTRLLDIPIPDSLGVFYVGPTTFLAYRMFDEYKVMGLAAVRRSQPLSPRVRCVVHAAGGRPLHHSRRAEAGRVPGASAAAQGRRSDDARVAGLRRGRAGSRRARRDASLRALPPRDRLAPSVPGRRRDAQQHAGGEGRELRPVRWRVRAARGERRRMRAGRGPGRASSRARRRSGLPR